jgi:hypothetical protein
MSRILDALRKAQSAPPARVPSSPPAQFSIAAVTPVPARAARPAAERPSAPGSGTRRRVVPFGASPELPADVRREMTGLRISLEAALTQRIPRTVMFLASQGGEGTTSVVDAHGRRPAYRPDGSPFAARSERGAQSWHARAEARSPDLMPLSDEAREEHIVSPTSLREDLDAVASAYDWIVIDGPPVLESPDAATLGVVADGILVVVQAGRTKRPVLARSVDLMSRAGGRVLGIVLNRRRLEIPGFIYRRI